MRVRIRVNWEIPKGLLISFLFLLMLQVLDTVSSMGHFPPGVHELNPYTRHSDGSFWLFRCVIVKIIVMLYWSAISATIYFPLRRWHKRGAETLACVPLIYETVQLLGVVLNNLMLHTGWLTPFGGN